MAYHHHHLHHQTTAATSCSCCCSQPPPPPPAAALPPLTADPFQIAAIVTHLLQTQNPNPYPNPPNLHDFRSHTLKSTSINRNQRYPRRETDQFQNPQSGFLSLLQRIDALEEALHHYYRSSSSSSASSFSLRDVAARTIQSHFRVYLVRRSRALGQLKDLASIKSAVASLKSSLSRSGFVDLDSLSSRAMELLIVLDSIQGEDKMIRDSKRSITNEIAQFLDLLDGVCVKRHQVVTKTMRNMRLVRNDNRSVHDHGREVSDRGVGSKRRDNRKVLENMKGRDERGSKGRNMSDDEKKLLESLKGRVEKISRLTREIDDEEEDAQMEGYKHDEEDGDNVVGNSSNHRMENRGLAKKHLLHPNGEKHVSFVEDGNVVRVYDIDENSSLDANEVEDDTKGVQYEDEDEAWNHVHRATGAMSM